MWKTAFGRSGLAIRRGTILGARASRRVERRLASSHSKAHGSDRISPMVGVGVSVGTALGACYWLSDRKEKVVQKNKASPQSSFSKSSETPEQAAEDEQQDSPVSHHSESEHSGSADLGSSESHSAALESQEPKTSGSQLESKNFEDLKQPAETAEVSPESNPELENAKETQREVENEGAYNPETGEINWDCPCLGGMAHGPCGEEFKEAFSCFIYSEADPKGIDCIEKFQHMQDCFRKYPEHYAEQLQEDNEESPKSVVEASGDSDELKVNPKTEKSEEALKQQADILNFKEHTTGGDSAQSNTEAKND